MGEKGISLIEVGSENSLNLNYFLLAYLLKCRDKSEDHFKLKFDQGVLSKQSNFCQIKIVHLQFSLNNNFQKDLDSF